MLKKGLIYVSNLLKYLARDDVNTRSMVYKGMVYKGQNISSTEDFQKN